ncbi:DNA/RNA polymerase superfamily protein [Gossypium australe]|uniref:DNA/RNA polymerase superfamily protein n=1 Tax=Gossypium australe TaxID=47621 RepID=A0A5B6UXE6_9ROSI|nr:DNA/RNA polymerase superfamily protein [Gossypium australe]
MIPKRCVSDPECNVIFLNLYLNVGYIGKLKMILLGRLQPATILKWKWDKISMNFISGLFQSYSDSKTSYKKLWNFKLATKYFLKVSPWKKVLRFGRKGKISLRFIGPHKIIEMNRTYYILIGIIIGARQNSQYFSCVYVTTVSIGSIICYYFNKC